MRVQLGDGVSLRNHKTSEVYNFVLIKSLPTVKVERINHLNDKIKVVEVLGDVLEYTSINSPIGKKIFNKEIGDEFEVVVDGHKIKYEIIEIS